MGNKTKIHLSALERELVKNKEWILTKHAVINKVYALFGELNEVYKDACRQEQFFFPGAIERTGGKISKGENYEGLPYVMLDYPALFSKENIFAVRTLFWWGNFFSITLHVSGEKFAIKENFNNLLEYLRNFNFSVCVNEKEWEHTFELSNYIAAKDIDVQKLEQISARNFFKISKNIELDKWDEAAEYLERSFREIIGFIQISFPTGEKALSPGFPKAGSGL
jgi:hypothetical protein